MKTIFAYVDTGSDLSRVDFEIIVEDNATTEEINNLVWEVAKEYIDYGWKVELISLEELPSIIEKNRDKIERKHFSGGEIGKETYTLKIDNLTIESEKISWIRDSYSSRVYTENEYQTLDSELVFNIMEENYHENN